MKRLMTRFETAGARRMLGPAWALAMAATLCQPPAAARGASAELREATETFQGARGGLLWVARKGDGEKVAECKLASIPVFDGLIAADKRLFLSQRDGSVVCMAGVTP